MKRLLVLLILGAGVCFSEAGAIGSEPMPAPKEEPSYVGIGVQISFPVSNERADRRLRDAGVGVKIANILKGGPADRAGFQKDDGLVRLSDGNRVLKVYDAPEPETLNSVMNFIRSSRSGSTITITVKRDDTFGFLRNRDIEVAVEVIDANWPYAKPLTPEMFR